MDSRGLVSDITVFQGSLLHGHLTSRLDGGPRIQPDDWQYRVSEPVNFRVDKEKGEHRTNVSQRGPVQIAFTF